MIIPEGFSSHSAYAQYVVLCKNCFSWQRTSYNTRQLKLQPKKTPTSQILENPPYVPVLSFPLPSFFSAFHVEIQLKCKRIPFKSSPFQNESVFNSFLVCSCTPHMYTCVYNIFKELKLTESLYCQLGLYLQTGCSLCLKT